MKKKKLIVLLFVILVIIVLVLVLKPKNKQAETSVVEVIDSIDDFSYELNDNETKYYNELFSSLKELLNGNDYNEDEYASLIGKLFLADFYDLDSKVMKSDVGGTQFVYESYRSDFELGAIDSVYKFVESNVYGDRKQSLPSVKSVEVKNISKDKYKYDGKTDECAYYLEMNVSYEKDLGYPTSVSLVMVHVDNKLEIASMDN